MERWKKHVLALVAVIIFFVIFFIVNGALKMVSIDRTLEDANEMIAVVSEYLAGDVENIPATEAYLKVEEIFNRDRYVKRGTPQEASRDDYDVGMIESGMDLLCNGMELMNLYDDDGQKRLEEADNVQKYIQMLLEDVIPKTK